MLYYDKIPDYVKEKPDHDVRRKEHIKVPMLTDSTSLQTWVHLWLMWLLEQRTGARQAGLGKLFPEFSPISFGQSKDIFTYSGKAVTPTAFKPVVDIIANETYFGGPVYATQSPYGAPKPNSSMSFRSPDMVKQFFSLMNEMTGGSVEAPGKVDINPDKFWHIFDYFIGGAGQFVTRTGETTFRVGQRFW